MNTLKSLDLPRLPEPSADGIILIE